MNSDIEDLLNRCSKAEHEKLANGCGLIALTACVVSVGGLIFLIVFKILNP